MSERARLHARNKAQHGRVTRVSCGLHPASDDGGSRLPLAFGSARLACSRGPIRQLRVALRYSARTPSSETPNERHARLPSKIRTRAFRESDDCGLAGAASAVRRVAFLRRRDDSKHVGCGENRALSNRTVTVTVPALVCLSSRLTVLHQFECVLLQRTRSCSLHYSVARSAADVTSFPLDEGVLDVSDPSTVGVRSSDNSALRSCACRVHLGVNRGGAKASKRQSVTVAKSDEQQRRYVSQNGCTHPSCSRYRREDWESSTARIGGRRDDA